MLALRKQRVKKPWLPKPVAAAFAREVKSLLGYNPVEVVRTAVQQQTLASVLYELGVTVFNPDSVARYKGAKAVRDKETGGWWRWYTHNLKSYHKPVPVAALKTAMRITKRCPKARFEIEELVLDDRTQVADPFLAVSLGKQRYYIAQWDEPTFLDEQ